MIEGLVNPMPNSNGSCACGWRSAYFIYSIVPDISTTLTNFPLAFVVRPMALILTALNYYSISNHLYRRPSDPLHETQGWHHSCSRFGASTTNNVPPEGYAPTSPRILLSRLSSAGCDRRVFLGSAPAGAIGQRLYSFQRPVHRLVCRQAQKHADAVKKVSFASKEFSSFWVRDHRTVPWIGRRSAPQSLDFPGYR